MCCTDWEIRRRCRPEPMQSAQDTVTKGCGGLPAALPVLATIRVDSECLRMLGSCETMRLTMLRSLAELGADTAFTGAAPRGRA